MTDREKFEALLAEWGVVAKVEVLENPNPDMDGVGAAVVLRLDPHPGQYEKIKGYMGFFVDVVFDIDGEFVSIGAWE